MSDEKNADDSVDEDVTTPESAADDAAAADTADDDEKAAQTAVVDDDAADTEDSVEADSAPAKSAKSAKPAKLVKDAKAALLAGGLGGSWTIAGLIAVVGLIVGLVGGIVGVRAYINGSTAQVRDAVVATAETAAMNVTTIDPRNPDKFKENVESVLTGRALQELRGKGFEEVLSRKDAPGRLESRVRRSAATEVNRGEKAGKALVYVEVVAKAPGQPDVPQTMGFLISVRKIDGKYMADSIAAFNPIPYADQQRGNPAGAQPNPPNPTQAPGGN